MDPRSASQHHNGNGSTPPSRFHAMPPRAHGTKRTFEQANLTETSSAHTHDNDLNVDQDALSEVVMAINMPDRKSLACAYYVARNETLYCMERAQFAAPDLIDALKLYIDPTTVIASTKSTDEMMDRLDPERHGAAHGQLANDTTRLPYLLECRPHAEFGFESARGKLAHISTMLTGSDGLAFTVPGDAPAGQVDYDDAGMDGGTRQNQLLRLSGMINMDDQASVGCCGAVLTYLQRQRSATYLPHDNAQAAAFRVSAITMFSMEGTMFINQDTLQSLQVTTTESHPNAQFQGPGNNSSSKGGKEGLSVHGLFQRFTKTQQGRRILKQRFHRPSTNLATIHERLDTISVLVRPDNSDGLRKLVKCLSKIKDMRTVTTKLRRGVGPGSSSKVGTVTSIWLQIKYFVFHVLQIAQTLNEMSGTDQLQIRGKILHHLDERGLEGIGKLIDDVVDIEASAEKLRAVVKAGIDPELDEIKRLYDGMDSLLLQVVDEVAATVPAEPEAKVNVIFFPQIGFLIGIVRESASGNGVYEGPVEEPWQKVFTTDSTAFFKDSRMAELDNEYGDVYGHICDKEIEIVQQMTEEVLGHEDLLNTTSDICGELDCLVALAQGAMMYNLVRPRVSPNNIVNIKGGRHLLQEMTVPSFVPNDSLLVGSNEAVEDDSVPASGSEGPSMVIVTGPNYSGKSVYLKQVAILVYLAHVGSFVPAEAAEIGLTDKILTRISTRESVSRIQSAFMIDLQQISTALSLATRRSLLTIDEFGKGTDSYDGPGLAAAVLEHLLQRGDDCPKTLVATHFHEIFEAGFLAPRPSLGFAHMEIRVDEKASEINDQLTYLYNCRPGRSNASFGTCCAAMNGIDDEVVRRAEDMIDLMNRGEDLVAACVELQPDEMEELEDAENLARDFLAVELDGDPRLMLDGLLTESGSSTSVS